MKAILTAGDPLHGLNFSQTSYCAVGAGKFVNDLTEANQACIYRNSGVLSSLLVHISANNATTASTVIVRKNTANGNQTLSIPNASTGEFFDIANVDTVASGDKFAYQIATGLAGTSFTVVSMSCIFNATTSTVTHLLGTGTPNTVASNGLTVYGLFGCGFTGQGTESFVQHIYRITATMKNFATQIQTNQRTTTTSLGSRKNTANGTLAISILTLQTGTFEDTTHSDSIVSGDIFNSFLTMGASAENLTFGYISVDCITTDNTSMFLMGGGSDNENFGTTVAPILCGNINFPTGSAESISQHDAMLPLAISNVSLSVSSNTINGASTFKTRRNAVNGNISISITASTTGTFSDLTNIDRRMNSKDLINYQLITGGTSGSEAMRWVSAKVQYLRVKDVIDSEGFISNERL